MVNVGRVVRSPRMIQTFTIRRKAAGGYVNEGEWQDGAESDIPAQGVVAPSTNSQIDLVPEGERTSAMISIYTQTALVCGNGETTKSDLIIWQGKLYEVKFFGPWETYGYYLAICVYLGVAT